MSDERIQIRQGDLLFTPVEINHPPIGFKESRFISVNDKYVLAEGEKTGHVHTVPSDLVEELFYTVSNAERIITVVEDTEVTHDEHPPAPLKAGDYSLKRQRRYVPREIPQPVID